MIRINNLTFSYGKIKIFDNFNLHIPKGESCLVTGINGVGKSTLLRLISGVLRPDKGEIILSPSLGKNPRRKIGFISDKLSLYESLTVKQSIELHNSVYGVSEFDNSLIRHTKIMEKQKIKELSIGQRTILFLSMILSAEPEILLIDEIIHSIDAYLRNFFLEQLIALLSDRKVTVIMVNLNFHDIEHIFDRVIMLKSGDIRVDETITDLKDKVKKIVSEKPPANMPIISQMGHPDRPDYYIYPFKKQDLHDLKGDIIDLNLTEIVTAFIGGEYS